MTREIHTKSFKGAYSEAALLQESAREGALANVFHYACTSGELIAFRNLALPTVLGGGRCNGIRVALFDGVTRDDAVQRIQALVNGSLN